MASLRYVLFETVFIENKREARSHGSSEHTCIGHKLLGRPTQY